jgi:hypothetical protein
MSGTLKSARARSRSTSRCRGAASYKGARRGSGLGRPIACPRKPPLETSFDSNSLLGTSAPHLLGTSAPQRSVNVAMLVTRPVVVGILHTTDLT